MSLTPKVKYLMEPLKWGLPVTQIWCFYLPLDRRYIDLQTGHFATLSSSKVIAVLLTLGKSNFSLLVHFYWLSVGPSYLTEFG